MLAMIEDFQTALVGIIGFAGVIWTLRHNAATMKRERLEGLEQEREIIRHALLVELGIIRLSLRGNIDAVIEAIKHNEERTDGRTTGVLIPPEPMTSSYDAFVSKIGLLGLEQLRPVMYAYLTIKTAWSRMTLWHDIEPLGDHLSIGGQYLAALRETWENLIPDIDKAIVALEGEQGE